MKTYGIAYTINGDREFEDFAKKSDALKAAKEVLKDGATKFVIVYKTNKEGTQDLVDYIQVEATN